MATGDIVPCGRIKGSLHEVGRVTGAVTIPVARDISYETYEGDYVVTPDPWDETVLETNNKLMTGNVTVEVIPYYETSNLSGGSTVYIGGN